MNAKIVTYIDSNRLLDQSSEKAEPVRIEAIGFVVEETEEYITLAQEIIGKDWRSQLSIPKKSIIETKDL